MRPRTGPPYVLKHAAGFGLLAVVGLTIVLSGLMLLAVPHVLAVRHDHRVATVTGVAKQIHQALTSCAAGTNGNYPQTAAIGTWQDLVDLVSTCGGPLAPLPTRPAQLGIQAMTYTSLDGATYTLGLRVEVPEGMGGKNVILTPAGITKE